MKIIQEFESQPGDEYYAFFGKCMVFVLDQDGKPPREMFDDIPDYMFKKGYDYFGMLWIKDKKEQNCILVKIKD